MATPRPPVQSKACTFAGCGGRMILTSVDNRDPIVESIAGLPPARAPWYWQCDREPDHTAPHQTS